MGFRNKY